MTMGKHKSALNYIMRCPRYSKRTPVKRGRTKWGSSSGKLVLGQKSLTITLLALLFAGVFFHLMLINSRVSKTFQVEELSQKMVELQKIQAYLEREAADLQSIQSIQEKLNVSEFIPTTDVSYLSEQDYALLESGSNNP